MKGFDLRQQFSIKPWRISKIKQGEENLISVNKMQENMPWPLHTVPLDIMFLEAFHSHSWVLV